MRAGVLERVKAIPRATWRDGARRGAQSAVAAVATYGLMRFLGMGELFVGILAAALILHPSVGGTMGAALSRLGGTVVGSAVGLLALVLLPPGWGTPWALALSLLVVGGLAGMGRDVSYGGVAAVAVALAPPGAELESAWERGLAIALGAGVGVLVALVVWPDRAEARFERHLRAALRATATRLADAVGATMERAREAAPPEHVSAYHKAVGLAEEALEVARFVDREGMRRRLEALRRLYNSVIILDRAAEGDERPLEEAGALREEVDRLREDACAVLTALAEGRAAAPTQVAAMDRALEALEAALREEDPASRHHRARDVVAFGLWQVRRSLRAVIEAERGA